MTNENEKEKPFHILLVEDNSTDVLLTEKALANNSNGRVRCLHVVHDGLEALTFLRQQGKYANAPRPSVILLDLNLPVKPGCEVLAELKADKDLRHIPVIVLSISKQELDIVRAYELNANCYVVKPIKFQRFRDVLQAIEGFWSTVATLPP